MKLPSRSTKNSSAPATLLPANERFINRELSWLAFNMRVLEEAQNAHNPLLERLNFLSISGSNLDEFYMVRVAGLVDQLLYGAPSISIDGMSTEQQLRKIRERAWDLITQQQQCWANLQHEMDDVGLHITTVESLHKTDRAWLQQYFMENLFPILTPIALDPAHPFPFIPNLATAQLFSLQQEDTGKKRAAILLFPSSIKRFVQLPPATATSSNTEETSHRFMLVERVIELFIDELFPSFSIEQSGCIRIIRDSDIDVEDGAEDLVHDFEQAIKRRRHGRVVRITTTQDMPGELLDMVMKHLQVDAIDTMMVEHIIGLSQLSELYNIDRPDLKSPPFHARFPERIEDFDGDCFAAIAAKDIVIHHPFESFDVVVQFIRQAARDPDVISIKGTLYRTSEDSPIIAALIEAAERGKSVTAVVELKARFDEEANIRWARDLERAGVQVVYGFVRLKTHSKVILITRKTGNELTSYVHFGTGNYHPSTARIYTDLSYFTCDETLCRDAAHFFNFVTGYAPPREVKKLILAPMALRPTLIDHIRNEVAHAKAGRPATIWAKMNALLDPEIIDELYIASQAGVIINLIIRGICSLRPQVKGLSENITVKSIVGRFLEHSRIYCFGNGHELPCENAKLFIASADWMPRNFDGRVEVMVPIENPTVHAQILGQIMLVNLKDEQQSWILQPDGSYQRLPYQKNGFNAHDYFINNPSLSGRGRAIQSTGSTEKTLYTPRRKK